MVINYEMTLDAAVKELNVPSEKSLVRIYKINGMLDPNRTLAEIVLLDPYVRTGFTLKFIVHDEEAPYATPTKNGVRIHGDPVLFQSPYWTPHGISNKQNLFFLLLKQLYGDTFKRPSGIPTYDQQRMIELHYSETWKNMLTDSEYGMPSAVTIRVSYAGFVLSLRQKGYGFNAKKIDTERITHNGGAAFMGYRETNGIIFFDSPSDAHEVFFMYSRRTKF